MVLLSIKVAVNCIFDFESYLHSVCLLRGYVSRWRQRVTAGRAVVAAASGVMKADRQCEDQKIVSHSGFFFLQSEAISDALPTLDIGRR